MSLNWDDLRIFLAVAREGNLSAAARHLRVTQPTVGRRLRALEQRLAARLFDRLPEGFVPTVAGAELLPLAEEMERSAEALERRQASLADSVSGTVRISVMEPMARFLAEFVSELQQRLPDIEIELAFTHLSANLSKREADLMIRECMPDNPGLIARKLGDMAYAVYGEVGLVERNPAARGEARYRDCRWVGYDEEHARFTDQRWLLKRLAGRLPAVRVNNGLVLHEAVRQGAGLGVLPCLAGDWDPALIRLTPPLAELASPQYLVVHRDLRRTPSVRAVMDELVALFQREAPRLLGLSGQSERVAKTA
ncbi:MAG: LysR family transcriptional regulator [Pirellulales bacterium]|nr:LysR family transcriptional regulator [Pirellulales bacterium]